MNKGIVGGIIVLVVIGIAFAMFQVTNNDTQQVEVVDLEPDQVEGVDGEPKSYTVSLTESVGLKQP